MRISVSMRTPKAFSTRSAMTPERSAWPFSSFESATRDTPSTAAASVTFNSSGSRISVRMNAPGCGGFRIRSSWSVVILIVHLNQFVVLNSERQPPVPRDVERPRACVLPLQPVGLPRRQSPQLVDGFHVLQEREHLAQLVDRVRREALRVVRLIQPTESRMDKRPNLHRDKCSVSDYTRQNQHIRQGLTPSRLFHLCAVADTTVAGMREST